MADRAELLDQLIRNVEELVEPHHHTEIIWDVDRHRNRRISRAWTSVQEGLLTQLRTVSHEGVRIEGDAAGPGGKPGSRPPGSFDALDRLVYITTQVERWGMRWGVRRRMPEETLRGLVGVSVRASDRELVLLTSDVRYWRASAAVATGWVERPYSPPVTCPVCSRFGTLRVNIEARGAYCVNQDRAESGLLACGAAWSPGTADPGLFTYIRNQLDQGDGYSALRSA